MGKRRWRSRFGRLSCSVWRVAVSLLQYSCVQLVLGGYGDKALDGILHVANIFYMKTRIARNYYKAMLNLTMFISTVYKYRLYRAGHATTLPRQSDNVISIFVVTTPFIHRSLNIFHIFACQ